MVQETEDFGDIIDSVRASILQRVAFTGQTPTQVAEFYRHNASCAPPLNPVRKPLERWARCAAVVAAEEEVTQ